MSTSSTLDRILANLRKSRRKDRAVPIAELLEQRRLLSLTSVTATDGVEGQIPTTLTAVSNDDPVEGWFIDWGDNGGTYETLTFNGQPTPQSLSGVTHTYTDDPDGPVSITVLETALSVDSYNVTHIVDYSSTVNPYMFEQLESLSPKPMNSQPGTPNSPGAPPSNTPPCIPCSTTNTPAPSPNPGSPPGAPSSNNGSTSNSGQPNSNNGVDPEPAVNVPIYGENLTGFNSAATSSMAAGMVYTTEPDLPDDVDGDNDAFPQAEPIASDPQVKAVTPHLVRAYDKANGDMMVAVTNGIGADWFDYNGTSYVEKNDYHNALVYDNSGSGSSTFTYTEPNGTTMFFYGFDSFNGIKSGGLIEALDAGGDPINTNYDGSGRITEEFTTDTNGWVTTKESILTSYVSSGAGVGNIASEVLREKVFDTSLGQYDYNTSWTTIQETDYVYYGSGDSNGEAGQLKTATQKDGSGNVENVAYYRYWTTGQSVGGVSQPDKALKLYLSGPSYARAAAGLTSGTPLTASDSDLMPYVDRYFEYDSSGNPSKMVAQGQGCSSCSGGEGTYTYSYTTNSGFDIGDYNCWALKTQITLPDGTNQYDYYDGLGLEMLSVTSDGTNKWGWFTEYDNYGRPMLIAQPSAVNLPSSLSTIESYSDLLHKVSGNYQYLNDSSGLVEKISYYSGSTATATLPGSEDGYISSWSMQEGETGTSELQESLTYYDISAVSGASIYPIATDTVYGNTDGTDARTTSYSYTPYLNTAQIAVEEVTYPTISSGQNGPGTADTELIHFDYYGNPVWTQDGNGHDNYTGYDTLTGAVIETIDDANYASLTNDALATFNNTGWSHPSGVNLDTKYQVDTQGRTIKETDPNGNVTYTVYNDGHHEVRVYPGFNGTTTTGPIQIVHEYYPTANSGDFYYTETLTSSDTPHLTGGVPDGTETISNVQSLQRDFTNAAGQVIWSDNYHLSGDYSPAVGADGSGNPADYGASGTNYYRTVNSYDDVGRPNRVLLPTGTITRTVYDALGRATSIWMGTDDAPSSGYWSPTNNTSPSNMMDIEDVVYDNGGVGDSDLTQVTTHPGLSQADRVKEYLYDWRDHQVAEKDGVQSTETDGAHRPIIYYVYDNLNEVFRTYQYDGDGVSLSDFSTAAATDAIPTADASKVRALTIDKYDDQGRPYRSEVLDIDQSNGTSGLSDSQILALAGLTTDTFYDHAGNVIAVFTPGGQVTKSAYDGADRLTAQYVTDGGAVNNSGTQQKDWTHAGSVSSDLVLAEIDYTYDSDGNVILTTSRDRFDNDSTSSEGALGSPSSGIGARVYYLTDYYDAADRQTDEVDVGTNGGTAYSRPGTVPSRSNTVLVTHTDYNPAGNVLDTIDPRDIMTQYAYDMLGRVTQEIDASSGGSPATGMNITNYTYDGDNHVLTEQAYQPNGTTSPSQTTQYDYGIGGTIGTNLFSNDVLYRVDYPNPSTGAAGTTAAQQVTFSYDSVGDVMTETDQNGTVHTYSYDILDRLIKDAVTTLGSGVDGSIRALGFTYTSVGLPYQQTSYSDSSGTTVANQVVDSYNGYGQLTDQYQAISGSVNTTTTPQVIYSYSQPSGANYSRLSSMTYPNGRVLDYVYNSGLDSDISRVSALADDAGSGSGNLQSYTYLGLGTIVQEADANGIELTYIKQSGESNGDAGDQYIGLDRFGRVVDQRWIPTSSPSSPTDRFQYGYDQDGNVLYKNNLVSSSFSELYHANSSSSGDNSSAYDKLNRITGFRRGTLSASGNNGSTLDTVTTLNSLSDSSQSWTLDALGNANSVTTDGTAQSRTFNSQNEATAVGSSSLAYDNNGNTTTDDQGHTLVYDAWNRLVAAKNGGTTIAAYAYEANGDRATETENSTTTTLYYSSGVQVLEERQGSTVTVQNVWGIGYVNQLVLRDDNSTSGSLGKTSSGLGERIYVQQDANYNVTALVNTSGTVLQRYIYTPYGMQTVLSPSWTATTDGYNWRTTFQGMRYDLSTGMLHADARDYASTLERWVEQDPTGGAYVDGRDLYQMGLSNPISETDSTGLNAITSACSTVWGWLKRIVRPGGFSTQGSYTLYNSKSAGLNVNVLSINSQYNFQLFNSAGKFDPQVSMNGGIHGFQVTQALGTTSQLDIDLIGVDTELRAGLNPKDFIGLKSNLSGHVLSFDVDTPCFTCSCGLRFKVRFTLAFISGERIQDWSYDNKKKKFAFSTSGSFSAIDAQILTSAGLKGKGGAELNLEGILGGAGGGEQLELDISGKRIPVGAVGGKAAYAVGGGAHVKLLRASQLPC